jgi:hypothetical protein
VTESASVLQLLGAAGFGVLVGWNLYFLNRYRTGDVGLADLVPIIGTVGGTAVLALFPAGSDLFGAYGIGLFAGFFGYFAVIALFVKKSNDFDWGWFLDGRRRQLALGETTSDVRRTHAPMDDTEVALRK